jgi:hypothetical protein
MELGAEPELPPMTPRVAAAFHTFDTEDDPEELPRRHPDLTRAEFDAVWAIYSQRHQRREQRRADLGLVKAALGPYLHGCNSLGEAFAAWSAAHPEAPAA